MSYFLVAECAERNSDANDFHKFMQYRCVHCHDGRHWIESFNDLNDVYTHWINTHTFPHKSKPFQYLIIELFVCYHCNTTGTYYELIKHHRDAHRGHPFAIKSQYHAKKCGLCSYRGGELISHFNARHKVVVKRQTVRQLRNVDVPYRIDNTNLYWHLERKVHKKQKCGICSLIFETNSDLFDHHNKYHQMSKLVIREIYDAAHMYLVCSFCNGKVDRSLYTAHIDCHGYTFKCSKCDFCTLELLKILTHDEEHNFSEMYRINEFKSRLKHDYLHTKVIFGTGLVVTKYNLLGTDFDDSKQFYRYLDTFVNLRKERCLETKSKAPAKVQNPVENGRENEQPNEVENDHQNEVGNHGENEHQNGRQNEMENDEQPNDVENEQLEKQKTKRKRNKNKREKRKNHKQNEKDNFDKLENPKSR